MRSLTFENRTRRLSGACKTEEDILECVCSRFATQFDTHTRTHSLCNRKRLLVILRHIIVLMMFSRCHFRKQLHKQVILFCTVCVCVSLRPLMSLQYPTTLQPEVTNGRYTLKMLFFASDFICSVVFVATVIGMSNGIVLPTGHSAATANHLDDLIRDVFTSNNSTTTNAAAGSNVRLSLCSDALAQFMRKMCRSEFC